MKKLFTLFFFTTTIFAFGQSNVDFGQIIKSWTQGKIDQDGIVIQADINRGGWYQLNINSDASVIFGDPFTCGFGHERHGKWTLNQKENTLVFTFSKRVGYMNSPGTTNINETENYKIKRLTSDELILVQTVDGTEKIIPFIKTKQ